jgi:hypothetical protein
MMAEVSVSDKTVLLKLYKQMEQIGIRKWDLSSLYHLVWCCIGGDKSGCR